jgi:hypothetical protein
VEQQQQEEQQALAQPERLEQQVQERLAADSCLACLRLDREP